MEMKSAHTVRPCYEHPSFSGLIGVAREDITPPVGIYARNWGASAHDAAEGIHKPLTTTVLTLQSRQHDAPLVLVGLDLGWWRRNSDEFILRGALLKELKLDESRVIMNLSHTHSGPVLCPADAEKPGGHLIAPYLERVRGILVSAVRKALENRQPATLAFATGPCDLATNRDLPDKEKPRVVVGYNPEASADTTLLVGRVTAHHGPILATLVNYACHPVTLAWQNKLISPDYVGAMREVIEPATNGAPCLFLQGASGELAPREQYTGDTAIADAHGRKLGYAALSTLNGMLPANMCLEFSGVVESGAPLATYRRSEIYSGFLVRAKHTTVDLPLKELPSVQELETALAACTDRVMAERLRRKRAVRSQVGDGSSTPAGVWVWRAGDTYFVAQQNEAYSLLQIELRRRFPGKAIVVMNLCNGTIGYLPRQELFSNDMYTVWSTPFEKGCLERVLEASSAAVAELAGNEQ